MLKHRGVDKKKRGRFEMERRQGDKDTDEKDAAMCQAIESSEPRDGKGGFSPELLEEAWLCCFFAVRLLASRSVREYISVI